VKTNCFEPFPEEITMSQQIHSYSELQQQIHQDLRRQHPDWVEPNGNCPTCDSYELRLAELIGLSRSSNAIPTFESSSAMSQAAAA
jgi:hypothetical protein